MCSDHQLRGLVGILHKLAFSNKGEYNKDLTTFNGQSINIFHGKPDIFPY